MAEQGNVIQDDASAAEGAPITLKVDIGHSFTYASFQNAIPVLRSIEIDNPTDANLEGCRLELNASPPFLRSKVWSIDRVAARTRLPLSDRKVDLDANYLTGLNEAERGQIAFRLFHEERLVAEHETVVRLLARDEWGGVADMVQLLPAFVMPNDPAVAKVLRSAADKLAAHGHPSGMNGYQTESPQRAFMLAAAIYSAVAGMQLHYAEPPASFEERGQKVRRPSTIAHDGLATCLDTSLLFAAALEAAGLHPVVLLFHGHAIAGVWLVARTFQQAIERDAMEVRKALASRELIVFETTGVTSRPPMTLDHARQLGERRLEESEAGSFVAAIDIRRARSGGITPLASHERANDAVPEAEGGVDLPLPATPDIGHMPAAVVEVKPTSAAGRIDRWQKKLLDLTLRNRLLNFPESTKTIPFLCTDVAYLEDRLAQSASVRLVSLPDQNPLGERDADLYREVRGQDINRGFAAEALKRDELVSPLEAKVLEARLIELHRQVRNDFAEGGANTLFLAVGFLRWRKRPEDERAYRAPLLLVPVKLDRRSASSQFSLRFHEDESRFNATLLQFLERDFNLQVPSLTGDLPSDDSGVDVPSVLGRMRDAVRDVPGMEVVDETALSTFSFAKFLMWKDLVERIDQLRQNRVVRHLVDTPDVAFVQEGGSFHDERALDRDYKPADIVSLLPADSSQIAASLAAAEGLDFVIVGPPGTGKSQTIANMIANCLAGGKTVLFVAEKTAALDVVHRRLREHGLADHCLELHSSKADRRRFLGQLRQSWEHAGGVDASGWVRINERLRIHRDQLNGYVSALHREYRCGLTPYAALGTALREKEVHAPALAWPHADAHDAETRERLRDLSSELGRVFQATRADAALRAVDIDQWSSSWQDGLLNAAKVVAAGSDALGAALASLLATIGLPRNSQLPLGDLRALEVFATALCESAGTDLAVMFDPDFGRLRPALAELGAAIAAYRSDERALTVPFPPDVVGRIPVDDIDFQWREACAAFWPKSQFARRRVISLLGSYAGGAPCDPDTDLPLLRRLQTHAAAIATNPLATRQIGHAGIETNTAEIERRLRLAEGLRNGLAGLKRSADETRIVAQAIAPVLLSVVEPDPVRTAAVAYRTALSSLLEASTRFGVIAGVAPSLAGDTPLADLARVATGLGEVRHLLRDWSSWCRVRRAARGHGLGPLIDDLENGAIEPDRAGGAFRLAYARWWLPQILDSDPVLRDFRRFQHEHAIEEFRQIDDLVRAEATSRVVAAIAHGLPAPAGVPRNSELGLLRHQMELQRPSRSIREMIAAMPGSFAKLAPCMLMSPLSIAQYLPPNQALFDVVIFDEASQITTWDAVGAIARARQTIIVGDPKQLPPTNFFGRNDEDEDVVEYERDLESILDEARAAGIPVRDLRWHYRSRSESLIAFSNHHYYQNRLITFPSPNVTDQAVRLRHVADGVYDRGNSRTNRIEARAVAGEAVARMRRWLALAENLRPTLGIITFNAQQQALIQDLLDEARRDTAELEWFFAEERIEPTIVKNLENVQGDERDVILFSMTFSADAAGRRTMDFGALNKDGGERRLNVAVTRARQELLVFSGFTADQIDPARARGLGLGHLKAFLDFAARGPIALAAQDQGSVGGPDSPFEEAVIAELVRMGWQTVPQVGISGFRVDIGIRHPDLAGAYLAGVECDGATYHRSATARDRDKVREQVLRGLGWNIVRVWSTDWWFDAAGAAGRLHAALATLLENSRLKRADAQPDEATRWDLGHEIEPGTETVDDVPVVDEPAPVPAADTEDLVAGPVPADAAPRFVIPDVMPPYGFARNVMARDVIAGTPRAEVIVEPRDTARPAEDPPLSYGPTDLSLIPAEPDRFYDVDYQGILQAMVDAIMLCEAPLREDVLAQRIARAHGWLRTGSRIRDRIALNLRDVDRTAESSGVFVWRRGTIGPLMQYRAPRDADSRRSIADIPIAELASMVVDNKELLKQDDPPLGLARLLGVERLAAVSRARLAEAIARAREHLQAP